MKRLLVLPATLLMLHGCAAPSGYSSWGEYCEENPGICALVGVLVVAGIALIAESASSDNSSAEATLGDDGVGDSGGGDDVEIGDPQYLPEQRPNDDGRFAAVMRQGLTLQADLRVIRDVRFAKTLDNGLRLHAFRYVGSHGYFVGVLAHEVAQNPEFADAVIAQDNGLLAVDYSKLGVRIIRADVMKAASDRALAAY